MSFPFHRLNGRRRRRSRSSRRLFAPGPRLRPGQPQMLAQGGAGVFLAEQATALEFGHDELDELLIGARDVGGGDDEAVARTLDEPLLHLVGDLLRAADDGDLGAAAEIGRASWWDRVCQYV